MSHPNFILDKRVVHRNISKGILTYQDLEDSIAKLKDVADNATVSRPEGLDRAGGEAIESADGSAVESSVEAAATGATEGGSAEGDSTEGDSGSTQDAPAEAGDVTPA